jgi:hypothetical protein
MTNPSDTILGQIGQGCGVQAEASAQAPSSPVRALSFFSLKVDDEWRGGWYRVQDGHLELYAAGQVRTVVLSDSDDPAPLLREWLTEMVRARH